MGGVWINCHPFIKYILNIPKGKVNTKFPDKVNDDELEEITKKIGAPPKGYKVGREFENNGKGGDKYYLKIQLTKSMI